MLDFKYSL